MKKTILTFLLMNVILSLFYLSLFSLTAFSQEVSLVFFKDSNGDKFRSCNLGPSLLNTLEGEFNPSVTPNIIDYNTCDNVGSWYCDSTAEWRDANFYDTTGNNPVNATKDIGYLTTDPDFPSTFAAGTTGCCPESYCFNGSVNGCDNSLDYANDPQKPPFFKDKPDAGYRCNEQGNWVFNTLKFDWNRENTGYCIEDTDCYGVVSGSELCFDDESWAFADGNDHYCEAGVWTSRTKFIAAELIDYAGTNDYTLFCDDHTKTLNEFQSIEADLLIDGFVEEAYIVGSGLNADLTFETAGCDGDRCANNFCVLKLQDKVILGTSLNRPINATPLNFLKVLGKDETYCDNIAASDSNKFASCDTILNSDVYYLKDKQIVIFSTEDFLGLQPTAFQTFANTIVNPIDSVITLVRNLFGTPGAVQVAREYIETISDFDRLYISVEGNKAITGAVESKFDPGFAVGTFMTISYTGFDPTINLCDAVSGTTIACTTDVSGAVVMFSEVPADISLWPDLTAKVRIS